ncbi:hypothetical protein B5M43_013660 [Microbacterium sp. MEC084]|uniref:hypothetical protein n=1 Tax=Microbacterium sp. MEC084 TaxID=1963027 RepID=UPI001431EC2C|nr:hypothetical protein [Microbacterium sp. MEC084]MCD1269870.1 hypothetical protein [Microbacterium sp. MEC084]
MQINHSELEADGEASDHWSEHRNRRVRAVAWVVIVTLLVTGGGATLLALLFG